MSKTDIIVPPLACSVGGTTGPTNPVGTSATKVVMTLACNNWERVDREHTASLGGK